MAAPYAPPNSPVYDAPEQSICGTTATVGRPNTIFTDDLRTTTIANCLDGINAAWNGWEQACKFEDEGLQTYYMKYITLLNSTLEKARKI